MATTTRPRTWRGSTPRRGWDAAVFPNEAGVGLAWAKYRVSVAEVEKLTGLTLFDRVPEKVRNVLKESADDAKIPAPTKGDR
jgi:DNA/RNA endonuclease G (NUC1)